MNLFKSLSKSIFLLCFFCAFLVFESCDVGLGESVDTIPPTISITYPPTSSVIRDAFVVSGTWVDDKGVSLVKVTVRNDETGATVASRFAGLGIGRWNTSFNVASKDESGKLIYPIPDGKYTISVTAMDLSGRISATSYRSIEIDNTAPVFVISKPGVLVDNNSSSALKASPFGSIFRIVGSIAEAHSVKSMEVKVFAKNGEGEPIASWKEEDINISGGTSVTFARFTNSKDKNDYLHKRYIDIYGDGTTGSKEFSCSVMLTDSAGVYQSDSYSDSNTLNYNGNKTSVVWLNDDINAGKDYDLLSKNANPQFEIGDLMKILNGTYNSSLTGKDSEAALNALKNTIKNTEEEKLAFSINKDANPTYSILGYGFDDTNYDEPNHFYKIISKAAQKGMLALRAQYGQDGTYFFPKELKVYVFGPYIPKEITDMEYNALSADERDKYLTRQKLAEIYDSVDNYYDTHKDNKDGECAWLIWDGSKEALDEGSTSNYSVSVQLPEDIKANNYYVIAVTGVDKDGLNFIPENSGFYGLIGASNGVPPVISLDSIEQGSYHKDISFLSKISGNIKSTETVIESVTYRVKILDILNKNNLVGVISGSALADDGKEFLNAQNINYYFGITEEQLKEKNVEISEGKMYAFEISVDGLDNTGGAASKTITAYLDTKKPEIKISSVSPIAKEKVVNEQTKQIINGIVKVIANVTEEYLENVNITVKDGNGKTYSPSVSSGSYIAFDFNTTEFKSDSQEDAITIEISAVDKAGNYNTLVDNSYVINQSSDTPLLETDTKEQSECSFEQIAVNNNLFGIKSNNKLTATITDDDGIGAITAVIYNKEDETVKDNKQIFSPAGKKTYNLTLNLPKEEGKYVVSIEAKDIYYDKNEDGKVTTDAQKSLRSFKKYYNVAVDAGNPVFNITTVNNAMTAANTAKTVEGTASDFSGLKSLVRYAVNKNDDSAEKTAAETWWFADPAKNDGKENTITFKDSTFKDTISADYIGGTDGRRRYIATDIYGNESIIDFVYFVDNKAPEITKITNPKDGEEIYNGNNIFALKGNAKDNKDLDKIRFCVLKDTEPEPETVASPIDAGEKNYKDASGWQSGTFATSNNSDGTTDFTCNIDLRDKDLGKYNVFIALFDKANNQSYVSSNSKILLTSDKDAPEIQTVEVSKPGYNLEDYNALTEIEISVKASDDVGLKSITVLKGSSELITKDVNEKTFDGTVILPVSKEAGKETLVDGTNTFSVVSTDFAGNSSETKTFTITLDSTPPDVSISSVTPIAAEEDGLNIINGVITIKGSVIESNLNSAYLEISDTSEPENKKVISLDTGKSIFTEMVDTTQFNDGGITIKLSATDVAGNNKELSETSYKVLQSTDSPSIETETKDSDSCALEDIAANNNLFGTKSNNKLTATITDDDGIAEVTAVIYKEDGTPVKVDTQTFNPAGKKTYNLTLTLPSDEAKYVVKINAKDIYYDSDADGEATDSTKKARRSFEKVYNVAVDAGNPAFNITTVNNAMTAANTAKTVEGTASDSSGLKSLVRYAIDSGDVTGAAETWWFADPAKNDDKANTITFEGTTFTDTISADGAAGIGDTDGRRRYIATDIYGNESIIDFVYFVDNKAPVITEITNPAGGSAIYNGNNIFVLKGKAKDNKDLDTIRFCVLKDTEPEPETVASPIEAGEKNYKDASGWQPGTFATSKNGDGTTDFTCNIDLHDNDPGEYKVFIALFDKANNQSYVSSNSKIVLTSDKNAPVTQTVAVSKTGYNLEDYNALSEIEISVKASDDVGLKLITVSKGGSELIKKDITGNEYDGTVTLGKETLIDGTNTFSVVSTDLAGNSSETKIFTITLDSTPPDVSISSVTPIAAEEDGLNIINGVITIKGSVIESNLKSATLEIYNTSEPEKKKVIEELETGNSIFTKMVDTTLFKDNDVITIKLSATDVAGNYKQLETRYEVRQSTDKPLLETDTKEQAECSFEQIAVNNNLFGTKSNNRLTATITDDDGIAEVTAVIYNSDETIKVDTQTFNPEGKKTFNLTLTLPSDEAKYVVKINAKDIYYDSDADGEATDSTKKARRSFAKVYNVGVDAGDPVLSLKTANNAMIAGNKEKTVEGTASDSGGLISLVRYAIGSGDVTGAAEAWWFADPAKNDDKANTITFEGTTFTDTISADGAAGIGDADGRRRYIATDIYGNTSTLDFSYLVDSLAPVIKVDPSVTFANGEWRASKTQKVQVLVTDTDEGGTKHSSGITNVKYVIDPVSANQDTIKEGTDLAIGASRDSDGNTSGNKVYNIYSTTFDFADDGIHSIYAGTWDSVGNYKQIGPITYKIDTTLPKILELLGGTGEAKASVAAPISMNANSHKAFNVYVTSDDKNGESSDVSGIKKIIIRKGSTDVVTDELDSAAVAVDSRKITIPADKITEGTNTFTVYSVDAVGNESIASSPIIINYDGTAPEVKFTSHKAEDSIYKTITLKGSVHEANGLSSEDADKPVLQYKRHSASEWTDAVAGTDYTSISVADGIWTVTGFDTTKLDNTDTPKTYDLRLVFTDIYGNKNDDAGITVSVDQNADRPVISLTTISEQNEVVSSRTIYGNVTDSDGTVQNLWVIENSEFDSVKSFADRLPKEFDPEKTEEENKNCWIKAKLNNSGSWSVNFNSIADSAHNLYFCVQDKKGDIFYTTETDTTAAKLARPRIALSGVEISNAVDNNEPLSFSIDTVPPKITMYVSNEALAADAVDGNGNTLWAAAGLILGGTKNQLHIKLEVIENNIVRTGAGTAGSPYVYRLPSLEIAGRTISPVALRDSTSVTGAGTAESPFVFLLAPIILEKATYSSYEGSKSVMATLPDISGQEGQGGTNIILDYTAPTVQIISPTAQISDAVSAAVTVKGIVTDNYSAIERLEYVIPRKDDVYNTTSANWAQVYNSGASWEIEFSSGSVESTESLCYYGKNYANYTGASEVTSGLGVYKVPMWFRATDSVGNIGTITVLDPNDAEKAPELFVYVDPDGGKPKAWINSPESGTVTSGNVTIYGGASDNVSVSRVCIQIDADNDGDFDEADFTKLKSDLSIETPVSYNAASFNTGDLVASSAQDKNDWYIVAEGTNSWKYTYNSSLLTVRDSKQNLRVRVRAIDNDGQTRVYSEANDILIDSTVPWFTNVRLCRYGSSFQGASDPDAGNNAVAEREYVSGMYISDVGSDSNGIWYLVANVNSNTPVSNVSSVSIPSTTSIVIDLAKDGTETFVDGATLKHARKTSENEYTLTIPLDTTQSGVIQAEISARNTVGNGSQQIKINIDSTPPALYNKNGSETYSAISEGAGDNKDLRVKSQYKTIGKNGTSSSAEYATIENSDGFFTFGDSVKESGSGLQYLAFYFKNTVSNTVYDPMNSKTGNVVADSKTDGRLYVNEDNLAAFYIANATRNAESTFEYSDLDAKFVRKGGLVKIGGTYHLISEVNNATKTVSFAPGVSKAFKKVEIIYAQVVDHMLTESFEDEYDEDDNKTVVIMNDDGDGMCETINQIGSVYQWTASINSNNIPDGTTEICVAAIDNAGNISSGKVESMVANNRPRITKVFIGTDLNGNNSYDFDADEAPVVSTSKKLRTADGTSFGEFNYYGAYDTRSGFGRSTVTIASNKFKVTNGLCVIPEFTGGNGSLKYVLTDGENSEPQTAPSPVAMTTRDSLNIKTVTGGISMFGNTAIGENGNENPVAYGITDKSDPGNPVTYGDFGGIVIDDVTGNDGAVKTLSFTFWDETDGKQDACGSQWAILNVPVTIKSGDSVPPVPRIKPFHWLSATDNSILIEEKIAKGHIELEDDLAGGKWSEIQTVFGDTEDQKKPKVSGKIKLEGTVYDDVRLSSIKLAVFGSASTVVSNYTNGAWVPASLPTGVVSFTAEDLDMSQNGHTVKYTAVIDTEKTSVGIGKTIVVNADDWKGNTVAASGSSQTKRSYALWSAKKSETDAMKTYFTDPACTVAVTEKTNDSDIVYKNEFTDCYIMDVVPYVTEVVTQLSPFYRQAPSVYARTALGSYPVKEGSSVEFKGFNLGTNEAQVTIRGMAKTSLSGGNKITIEGTSSGKTGATSGAVSVYVNDIPAINNLNNNNAQGNANKILTSSNYEDYAYNRQPNGINNNVLTDDLELDVWQFKEAARAKNGSILQPHMKVGPTGQLGFSYANATLYFNMPGKASDGTEYGQTPFGRNFGGFTQNAFTYDSSGTAYGVALCPDTSGQAGMSANLQFFSGKSGLDGNEGGGDLNNNYYNQDYARRIENTSLKLDGSSITQNINRIQSPSMTTYTDGSNKYVYVAYYDELSRQVRFRVGSIGSSSNVIGMGLVDLAGATGRVSGSNDTPKLNRNTTRDSISGYRTEDAAVETISVSSVTSDIYVRVSQNYGYKYIHAWEGYSTGVAYPGVQMPLVNGYYIYKMPDTSSTKLILNNGGEGDSNKAGGGNLQISSSGVYSWNGSKLEKLTSGTISYQSSSSTMPTYEGYQYCHVVAASGVSNGTAEYKSATGKKAGQYVSVGALSDGTAVMAWYDSGAGRLAFSYNSEPLTAKTTLQAGTGTWQNNSYYVSDSSIRAGTHVSMAVDASDGIHLAYYSASGGDLYYSYIKNPKAQSKPTKTVMVDSYGSVGTYTMIDVARDSETSQFIPYISFRCESNADTTASVKIAYPVQWSEGNVLSGVDEYDRYTGNWEVSVIPTDNTPLTDYTNIGLNKNWSTGVRSAFSTGSDVSKSWSAIFAVGDSTTVYGNGTDNPILSYAVSENGVLEMAQKK